MIQLFAPAIRNHFDPIYKEKYEIDKVSLDKDVPVYQFYITRTTNNGSVVKVLYVLYLKGKTPYISDPHSQGVFEAKMAAISSAVNMAKYFMILHRFL